MHPDCDSWLDILGLQIIDSAGVVEGAARAEGLLVFRGRFADVKAPVETPKSGDKKLIADRLKAARLLRLTPSWIRVIDDRRGFGHEEGIRPVAAA